MKFTFEELLHRQTEWKRMTPGGGQSASGTSLDSLGVSTQLTLRSQLVGEKCESKKRIRKQG